MGSRPRVFFHLSVPETDSLYIDPFDRATVESREISAGVVLDHDAEERIVGIDHARQTVELLPLALQAPHMAVERTVA